ncbi:MAG: hypothetical protein FWE25_09755 [Lachnospiraceae bacterium]|nr:hypothetical protein [Lachnospiraceae bacterium]
MENKTVLFLCERQREGFKSDLSNIKELFFERVYPPFSKAELEAEQLRDEMWNDINCKTVSDENVSFDPSEFIDFIQEQAYSKYEILNLMRYRTLGMWISCMCQVWEQQLYTFIVQEERHMGSKFLDSVKKRGFGFVKDVFELHGQNLDNMKSWKKLNELRLLVNVIKHSEGDSEKKLRKLRPDYFQYNDGVDNIDLLKLFNSTLLETTLQINEKDFIDYFDALIVSGGTCVHRFYF